MPEIPNPALRCHYELTLLGPIAHPPTMPSLHLLNQEGPQFPQPRETAPGVMESGFWLVSEARACAMIGHPIHFHRRKADPAFLSGIVTSFRRSPYTSPKERTSTRTIFTFTPTPANPVTTSSKGWTLAGVKFLP